MNTTPEQSQAIRTEGKAIIVEAGAGTGKTTVLTQRFLHLLEQHPHWAIDSIVAVTFTEKAANEMRSRIRKAIEAKANDIHHPHRAAWQRRRLEADRLQVSTVHALCARILRENAITAEIDPRFAVLEEVDALILREEAVSQTLRDLAGTAHPALTLLDYIHVRTLEQELGNLLQRRGTVEPLFETLPDKATLLAQWRTRQGEVWQAVWDSRRDVVLESAMRTIPALTLPTGDDKLILSVEAAQEGLAALAAGDWVLAIQRFDTIKLNVGRAAVWGGKDEMQALKAELKALREAAEKVEKAGATPEALALDATAAELLQHWRDMWMVLTTHYDDLKSAQNGLDFTDLERCTMQLLLTTPRPRRLDGFVRGIQQLMVDEYQDTNRVQQAIIYALAHPSEPRLFVVGDVKQSIYRFREADVAVYQQTRLLIEGADGVLVSLSRSFRSHVGLVTAVNALFSSVFTPLGATAAEYEAAHRPLESSSTPPLSDAVPHHVKLVRLPHKNAEDKPIYTEESRTMEATYIAEWLSRCEREGLPIRTHDGTVRPFRYGDAALLLRSFTDVYRYEAALKAADIPYITVGGRGYFNLPEIEDVLALLCALDNPADDLNLAAALRSPLFALSDDTLFRLRWWLPNGERSKVAIPLRHALQSPPATDEPHAVRHAADCMARLWAVRGRIEVWQLLQEAVTYTGYLAVLARADAATPGNRQRRNVEKLLELARTRGGASLSAFIRDVETRKINEVREGEAIPDPDAGVVQLMTIHAAKGLEFPVIVLADVGRTLEGRPADSRLLANAAYGLFAAWQDGEGKTVKPAAYQVGEWLDKRMEAAEQKRLLYVACTRAADWLFMIGQRGRSNSWLTQMETAWGIPDELPETGWDAPVTDFRLQVSDVYP